MCGIGLIVHGIELAGPVKLLTDPLHQHSRKDKPSVCYANLGIGPKIDDLIKALARRGPDQIHCETVYVGNEENRNPGFIVEENASLQSKTEGDDALSLNLQFVGSTLQLRGLRRVIQPLRDIYDNVLVYNGEVFGGLAVGSEENDSEVIMSSLQKCCSCSCHAYNETLENCLCKVEKGTEDHKTVVDLLSCIKGPWSIIYWQAKSKTLWFGRDALGRRSLLVHWPSQEDARLLFSSVATFSMVEQTVSIPEKDAKFLHSSEENAACALSNASDLTGKCTKIDNIGSCDVFHYWEELSCAIYSITFQHDMKTVCRKELPSCQQFSAVPPGWLRIHDWQDSAIDKIVLWERKLVNPGKYREVDMTSVIVESYSSRIHAEGTRCFQKTFDVNRAQGSMKVPVAISEKDYVVRVLIALRRAVERRTSNIVCTRAASEVDFPSFRQEERMGLFSPVAILFSGGLDSMILAVLADQCLPPNSVIDLLNVSFEHELAPDRLSALAGVKELRRKAPARRWRLVEVDGTLASINKSRPQLLSLICPSRTYMDLNIGTALWSAASGDGWIEEASCRRRYRSDARVLLVGTGADEQCAGYSRHRTKYKLGGWEALQNEMRLDMQRLWKRNLGRDDRCIADHGKEARFPYLDEEVIQTLLEIPLWEIANLEQPAGQGDKKILREIARYLELDEVASLPKRAIQFGSRISRESNKSDFGSNRAANQASAGSATIRFLT